MNINENTGDYDYKFIAYAFNISPISKLVTGYAYCAILNGDPQHPEWLSNYSYRYGLGDSYNAYFLTEYGGVQKYAYLKFQLATYWNVKSTVNTYYSTLFSFSTSTGSVTTEREFVGVAVFSINTIGEFIGTESEWSTLSVPMLSHVYTKSSSLYVGYANCTGTSLYTATITVATVKISLNSKSTISTKTAYPGSDTIYVFGISKVKDSTVSGNIRYRYSGSLLETLTESSWSTTKPSI